MSPLSYQWNILIKSQRNELINILYIQQIVVFINTVNWFLGFFGRQASIICERDYQAVHYKYTESVYWTKSLFVGFGMLLMTRLIFKNILWENMLIQPHRPISPWEIFFPFFSANVSHSASLFFFVSNTCIIQVTSVCNLQEDFAVLQDANWTCFVYGKIWE